MGHCPPPWPSTFLFVTLLPGISPQTLIVPSWCARFGCACGHSLALHHITSVTPLAISPPPPPISPATDKITQPSLALTTIRKHHPLFFARHPYLHSLFVEVYAVAPYSQQPVTDPL